MANIKFTLIIWQCEPYGMLKVMDKKHDRWKTVAELELNVATFQKKRYSSRNTSSV